MSTTLTLSTSKLLYDLVGEYETEKEWQECLPPENGYLILKGQRKMDIYSNATFKTFPAPTFAELIRVLPRIMEKAHIYPINDFSLKRLQYKLVDLYMFAPIEPEAMAEIEKYILTLLK